MDAKVQSCMAAGSKSEIVDHTRLHPLHLKSLHNVEIRMNSVYPKKVQCEYCNETVHKDDTPYRLLPMHQAEAHKKLQEHYKICTKYPEEKKRKTVKNDGTPSPHISSSNCPICSRITRSDRIISHIMSNHDPINMIKHMHMYEREQVLKAGIPILKCWKGGRMVFRVCLGCNRGCLATKRTKIGSCSPDASPADIKRKEKHTECCAKFEDFRTLFESQEPQEDLPLHILNTNDPDKPVRKTYVTDSEDSRIQKEDAKALKKEKKERRAAGYASDNEEETPKNSVVLTEDVEALHTKIKMLESLLAGKSSEVHDLKEKLKAPVLPSAPADSGLLEIVPLLRQIADDKYEEMDTEDLLDEFKKYIARNADIENSIRRDSVRALAKKDTLIAKLRQDLAEKEEYISALGTLSFGRGGQRLAADNETDSD